MKNSDDGHDLIKNSGEPKVKCAEYGNRDGKLVVYFHGAPGAMEECALFDSHAKKHKLKVICFDRSSIDNSLDRRSYYQQLADQIRKKADGELVNLIGFSIGAHVALEVGALLNDQVQHTHLVSAAAPLNSGNFIDNMAGGLVFKLAMAKPSIFFLLTQCQRIMAVLAPRMLVRMLFSSAAGKDIELIKCRDFKNYITPVLKHCFQNGANGYIRDIKFYVTWSGKLSGHTTYVNLWHGTEDNWTPFSMASYLSKTIPGATDVNAMEGLSHYSCLYQAAPKICAHLEEPSG
ncbi:MAG: alpha/beta hydrolase [Halioglobus sp.]